MILTASSSLSEFSVPKGKSGESRSKLDGAGRHPPLILSTLSAAISSGIAPGCSLTLDGDPNRANIAPSRTREDVDFITEE